MSERCNVCLAPLPAPIYDSGDGRSLTSLARVHPGATRVRACAECGHVQTDAIEDVAGYYDHDYDILVDSEEEDQIYQVRDGKPVYRTAHQVATLAAALDPVLPVMLLDYGCAKASTIRELCAGAAAVTPHLFDVSSRYLPFWRRFADPANCAVDVTPPHWQGRFDVVTSFFSLEHIPDLAGTLAHIRSLLKPGGFLHAVVPNVFDNIADLIVIDHCNHFTATSLRALVTRAGLELEALSDRAHDGAFVLRARRPLAAGVASVAAPAADEVAATGRRAAEIAAFWSGCGREIRAFEAGLPPAAPVAVYGAGFYGAFIAAALRDPGRIACHLDQNPFLQGRRFDGRPILAPDALPDRVRTVLVGLNPARARDIIAAIPALARPDLDFFFLQG